MLGLSPATDDAWTWLRGEPGNLSDERRRDLLLTDDPPDATSILQTVATLLTQIATPLVLCLDQLEWLLEKDATAFVGLSTALMAWLQQIPNLVVVVGCMNDAWGRLAAHKTTAAFLDRTREWRLDQISAGQGVAMVVCRLRSWAEFRAGAAPGWPFDLAALQKFIEKTPPGPRGLLQVCGTAFDKWLAEGARASSRSAGPRKKCPWPKCSSTSGAVG